MVKTEATTPYPPARLGRLGLWLAGVCLFCCCGLLASGCRSTRPEEARFAGVLIKGYTPESISDCACVVFREEGYKVANAGVNNMVFEKEASTMSELAYGNFITGRLWMRVKVSITPADEGHLDKGYWLGCQAYYLRTPDTTIEEEFKVSRMGNHAYKKLLKKVAARLKVTPPESH